MQKLGHEIVEWKPTVSHGDMLTTTFNACLWDGATSVHKTLALSGEPIIPQLEMMAKELPQYNATGIMEVNVEKRQMQKQYMEYWNSSAARSKDGSVVDCIISPVAPYPAARRELYKYYGYTTWVNFLDYTSVVVPVTTASKELDPADQGYTPINEDDKAAFEACELHRLYAWLDEVANRAIDDADIYDGAAVGIQLVGRRLQEEKMLAIADYVSKALHG